MASRGDYSRRGHGAWQPNVRQRDVLDLLAEGKTNAEIAVRLGITVDGAKWHVGELLAETGCEDRQALASWWRKEPEPKRSWLGIAWLRPGWLKVAGLTATAVVLLVVVGALISGDRSSGPVEEAAGSALTPTPRPEEQLEALAAAQGPPPATCEPPEAQDLRIVTAAELVAEGLEPAGRVLVAPYCPLYVANRADRAVLWMGGASIAHFDPSRGHRLMSSNRCCMTAFLSVGGQTYNIAGYAYEPGGLMPSSEGFAPVNASSGRIGDGLSSGSYLMLSARQWEAGAGAVHRLAVSSDGQVFLDSGPVPRDLVLNHLTGETIDVSNLGPGIPPRAKVSTESVRTDCWAEEGVCKVYLDGVGAEGEGVFNPPTMLAPYDATLSCVEDEGGWSIDGPALAYELSNGPVRLRIGAFGGYWEEYEDCEPRLVLRGEELEVWVYTYIEASADGVLVSVVATLDGRLYIGEVDMKLDCPCELRK